MGNSKNWSYEEDEICVDEYFKNISFEKSLKSVSKLVAENVEIRFNKIKSQIKKSSFLLKISNIDFKFRELAGLPKAGLEQYSARCSEITENYFKKSNFNGSTIDKFGADWKKTKNKSKYKIFDEKEIREITNRDKLFRISKLKNLYLENTDECELCGLKDTFISEKTKKKYFEVHHFIPYNIKVQRNFECSLDTLNNLISLCPNCHRKIHLSIKEVRNSQIDFIFEKFKKDQNNDFLDFFRIENPERVYELYDLTYGELIDEE